MGIKDNRSYFGITNAIIMTSIGVMYYLNNVLFWNVYFYIMVINLIYNIFDICVAIYLKDHKMIVHHIITISIIWYSYYTIQCHAYIAPVLIMLEGSSVLLHIYKLDITSQIKKRIFYIAYIISYLMFIPLTLNAVLYFDREKYIPSVPLLVSLTLFRSYYIITNWKHIKTILHV